MPAEGIESSSPKGDSSGIHLILNPLFYFTNHRWNKPDASSIIKNVVYEKGFFMADDFVGIRFSG